MRTTGPRRFAQRYSGPKQDLPPARSVSKRHRHWGLDRRCDRATVDAHERRADHISLRKTRLDRRNSAFAADQRVVPDTLLTVLLRDRWSRMAAAVKQSVCRGHSTSHVERRAFSVGGGASLVVDHNQAGKVAMALARVQSVADHEQVVDREADIIHGDGRQPP
jgi:hypothetical protein